jgi:hypothetical protein
MIQANTLAKLVTIATLTWTLSAARSGQQEPFAGIKRFISRQFLYFKIVRENATLGVEGLFLKAGILAGPELP